MLDKMKEETKSLANIIRIIQTTLLINISERTFRSINKSTVCKETP
jgi:hypothetical protein